MKRNLRFILLLIRLKFQHLTVFRLSFFGTFFSDGVLFILQLLTFNVIYGQVDSIGNWSRGQMIIFIGTFSILNGLSLMITYFGIATIPGKIRDGSLDHYITKPVNPLLRLTFESINVGSFPLLLLSILIVVYGVRVEGIVVTLPTVFAYSLLVLLMSLLWYDLALILRTLPFFVQSTGVFDRLEDVIFELNFKIPGVFYKGAFKILFYFILPYGILSTVPTQFITGTLSMFGLLQAMGAAALFTVLALWLWKQGLKRYKSASS